MGSFLDHCINLDCGEMEKAFSCFELLLVNFLFCIQEFFQLNKQFQAESEFLKEFIQGNSYKEPSSPQNSLKLIEGLIKKVRDLVTECLSSIPSKRVFYLIKQVDNFELKKMISACQLLVNCLIKEKQESVYQEPYFQIQPLCQQETHEYTLVLDLDETLVHFSEGINGG